MSLDDIIWPDNNIDVNIWLDDGLIFYGIWRQSLGLQYSNE